MQNAAIILYRHKIEAKWYRRPQEYPEHLCSILCLMIYIFIDLLCPIGLFLCFFLRSGRPCQKITHQLRLCFKAYIRHLCISLLYWSFLSPNCRLVLSYTIKDLNPWYNKSMKRGIVIEKVTFYWRNHRKNIFLPKYSMKRENID